MAPSRPTTEDDGAARHCRPRPTDERLRDQIDVVKAALDGTPPPPRRRPVGPPRQRRPLRRTARADRRGPRSRSTGSGSAAPSTRCWPPSVLLPIVTFAMAYVIVDVPKPGDIRTAQVSTILAGDGSELAKIVPPEGNRVDVNIDQIPVHVRDAVMAAEDRDFYTNPGFSFNGLPARVQEQPLRRRPAGRIDDHAAVREERVGRRRAIGHRRRHPQGQGTRHLDQDVARVVEGRGDAVVPEHHLLRPQRVRHLRGGQGVLRQAGRTAHACPRGRCWPR